MVLPIEGFQQDPNAPPGVGQYQFAGGQSLYADASMDPELAAYHQQQQAQQLALGGDQSMAPNMSPAPQDLSPMPPGPPPSASDANQSLPLPAEVAPPPPLPGAGPPPRTGPPSLDERRAALGQGLVWQNAVPASPGGWQPSTKSVETITQGAPYNADEAQQRVNEGAGVMNAGLDRRLSQASQMERTGLGMQARSPADWADISLKQTNAAFADRAARTRLYNMNADLARYAESGKPSEAKLWQERGAFAGIAAAIAQAMGAYGATLGHTQNFAQEIIEAGLNRDMAAARDAYANGVDLRNNAIARFEKQYGFDHDQAALALENAKRKQASDEYVAQANLTGAQDKILEAQEFAATQKKLIDDNERAIRDKAIGKAITKSAEKYHPATGGKAAGFVPGAPKQIEETAKAIGAVDKISQTQEGGDPIWNGMKPDQKAIALRQYSEDMEKTAGFQGSMDNLMRVTGGHINAKGEISFPKGAPGFSFWGRVRSNLPDAALTQEQRNARQAVGQLASNYAYMMTGATATDAQYQRYYNEIMGSVNESGLQQGIQGAYVANQRKVRTAQAGASPALRTYYSQQYGDIAQQAVEEDQRAPKLEEVGKLNQ